MVLVSDVRASERACVCVPFRFFLFKFNYIFTFDTEMTFVFPIYYIAADCSFASNEFLLLLLLLLVYGYFFLLSVDARLCVA